MDTSDLRKIRVRQLIEQRFEGIAANFADAVNRTPSYVSRMLASNKHSRGIGEEMARSIEQKLGLDNGWLDRPLDASEAVPAKPKEATYTLEPVGVWDDETPLDSDEAELPFLKEVELSAGSGRTAIHEAGSRKMRFGIRTMRSRGVEPANAVCVTVTGNSMEPVLRNGATISIDRGMTRIQDGDMYAIDHDGQLRVKQLYRMPGGGMRIRSFNRDEHPDEEYGPEEIERHKIRIIGRVWWGASFF
ncbi:transcriptional regulator [Pseudomonas sp. MT-1]|nr:transcriptional regulator [Pseudomonas sp. MT-1]